MNFTKLSEKVFTTVYAKLLLLGTLLFATASSFGQAPPNDNACQATQLTPGTTCTYVQSTNVNGTTSTGTVSPSCAGFAAGRADVWFYAIVPAGGALTFDVQGGTMTDGGMALYRGTNCFALTFVSCDGNSSANPNMPSLTVTGLVPGSRVYARVWAENNVNGTFGICATIPAPPPANDNPCAAADLTVSPTCNYQTFTTESATNTTSVPAPFCASYNGGDVWFRVVVPAGVTALVFDTQQGVVTEGGMLVYTGSACTGTLSQVDCDSNSSANPEMPKITAGGLTPGDTVWVRFWERGNNHNGTFGICVTLPPPPPANDDPCTAAELIASETCTYQQFTNANATGTSGLINPGCANYNGGDVWFKVIIPPGGALSIDTDEGTMTDGGMAVYTGTCNSLTLIDCDDNSSANGQMPAITVAGLTAGDTLWVRVWENNGDNNGTFGICAKIPPPGPVNDDPCGAIQLTLTPTCTPQTFSNESSTGTSTVDPPSCTTYNGGDVWFKVVVPAEGVVVINTAAGGITDAGMAAYSGTCGNLTEIECDDDDGDGNMPKLTLSGLTPGDTIWIRVWEFGGDLFGTFGICVTPPPPPPANDNVCTATELPVEVSCNYQTFTTADALNSPLPDPGCGNYDGSDVWFKVVVPAGGAVQIDTDEGVVTDAAMAAYTGPACNSLSQIGCDDDGSANGDMPKLVLTGLTPGDTVWVRVWEAFNDNNGTFGICATIPPPPPANDDPCGAVELPVDPLACNFQSFTNESATDTPGAPAPGCANYQGTDIWFKVVVPAGGAVRFNTDEGQMTDGGMAIYSGNCSALTLVSCDDNSSENGLMPKITLTGLNPGDTLWVRMWSNGDDNNGTFSICATVPPPPPANDNPCNAIPLTPDSTCTYQTYTTENASGTPGLEDPGCANYEGGDVWFSVVVPSGGALAFDSQTGVITDGGMAIYRGSCNNLTLIECNDDGSDNGLMSAITAGGLVPGDTIWVRFWEFGNDNPGTFGICVKLLPPGPVNDDPCGAIEIPVAATCTYQTFSNENSFGTATVPDPGCASYDGGDVWFKVVVPAEGAVTFDTQSIDFADGGMAVYSGTCNNLTLIECDDDDGTGNMPKITVGGLAPGDTLWVRVWESFNDDNGNFGICATIPPPPPVNDNPCTSTSLPVEAACNFQQFTNDGAFSTAGVPAPGCANYAGGDVWFNVIVPADGALTFDTQAGVVTDGGMAVYSGTCNNLTLIECDDDDGAGTMPKMTIGGLTPGDTLWIRFWEDGNNNNGTFGICVTIPPPPPVNDNPCGAIALVTSDLCNYQNFSNEGSFGTSSVPDPGCGDYQGSDVWFSAVVPRAGALNINTIAGTLTDAAMAIYKADSCNGVLQLVLCDDNGSANTGMPYITATGLTPGSTVWIRVWSNGGVLNQGTFGICAQIPPLQPATFAFSCSRDTSFTCGGGDTCFTLQAIIPDIHKLSDRYAVNPLSAAGCFNPYSDPGNEGPSVELRIDDRYTDVINLPFSFPFFGTIYNALVASTNGYVSFDLTEANQFSHWNIINNGAPQNLPSDFYDRALIMGPYHDLDPQHQPNPTQRIKYNVTGQAPNRRWVLSFYKVPLYDCDELIENTHQIVLYEGIGVIEVFLFDMQNCLTWNQGRAMVGIQDFSRTRGLMAPGRRASDAPWGQIGMNESWRFVPIAGPRLFKRVELFDTTGTFLATGDTSFLDSASLRVDFRNLCALQRLPAGLNTLLIRATYESYDNPGVDQVGADTIQIFLPNLRVNFDVTNANCTTPTGSVNIHMQNGVPPLQFSSDSGVTWQSDSSFSNLALGTYYIKVKDANDCARDTIVTIELPGPIFANYTVNSPRCNSGNDGSVIVSVVSGGSGTFEYAVDANPYQSDDSLPVGPGTHIIRIRDNNGCTKDTTIIVTGPAAITATYTVNNVKCFADNSGSIVIAASGGTGTFEYALDAGSYQSDDSFAVVAGTYIVHIRDANGCLKDSSITVTQPNPLVATASAGSAGCNTTAPTGSVTVTTTGGTRPLQYSKDGVNFQPDSTFNGLGASGYSITVKDANSCSVVVSATVGVANDLVLSTREDTVICGEASVVLNTNTNAESISWSPATFLNSTTAASPTAVNPTTTTEYVVTAQTGNCQDKDTVSVIVTQPPTVNAGPGVSVVLGVDAQLNGSVGSNATSFAWSPTTYLTGETTLTPMSVRPQETIVYTLTATNAEGCSSSDTVTVTVLPYCIKVKNAFTPNGDGVNDTWMVYDQFGCLQNVKVQVFNRYGSRVFQSQNYRNDWRGTYNGKNLPDATYYYVIDFLLSTGINYQVRGDVTILR